MFNPKKQQPKSVKQIVQELMFEELLEKDRNQYRQKHSRIILNYSKNYYRNYLHNSLPETRRNQYLSVHQSPHQRDSVSTKNVTQKPELQRGISISTHIQSTKLKLPSIKRKSIGDIFSAKKETEHLRGYDLVSEEMSFNIDEYVQMHKLPQIRVK